MKKFLDLSGLTLYNSLIKQVIASAQTAADNAQAAADKAQAAADMAQASANTAHAEALEAMASAQTVDAKVETLSGVVIENELVVAKAINELQSGITRLDSVKADKTEMADVAARLGVVSGRVDVIDTKIMAGTTSDNQLTNKEYVDTAVQEYAAEFWGTYSLVDDLKLPAASGEAWVEVASALTMHIESLSAATKPNKNDYAFVYVPGHEYISGSTSGYVQSRFDRYVYILEDVIGEETVPAHFEYAYSLNNSSFTTAQWNAINSNITDEKRQGYDTHVANTDIHVTTADKDAWNNKASSADMETLSGVVIADKAALAALSGVVGTDIANLAALSGVVGTDIANLEALSGVVAADKADLVAFSASVIENFYDKSDIDDAHMTISKAINALETNKATKAAVEAFSGAVVSAITELDETKADKTEVEAFSGAVVSAITELSGAVVSAITGLDATVETASGDTATVYVKVVEENGKLTSVEAHLDEILESDIRALFN